MSTAAPTVELPEDVEQLVFKLRQRIDYQESIIGTLHDEIALLKKRIFAQSSERFTEDKGQLKPAFDKAEATADESAEESEDESEEITCRRRVKGRKPIAPHIPREEVIHEIKIHGCAYAEPNQFGENTVESLQRDLQGGEGASGSLEEEKNHPGSVCLPAPEKDQGVLENVPGMAEGYRPVGAAWHSIG